MAKLEILDLRNKAMLPTIDAADIPTGQVFFGVLLKHDFTEPRLMLKTPVNIVELEGHYNVYSAGRPQTVICYEPIKRIRITLLHYFQILKQVMPEITANGEEHPSSFEKGLPLPALYLTLRNSQ